MACLVFAIRSGPWAVVTYAAPAEPRPRIPGVLNCGSARARSLRTVSRKLVVEPISIALTHTSPSPCAPCASPTEKSAPSTSTRQVQRAAGHHLFDVDIPAGPTRRHCGVLAWLRNGQTHHPAERIERYADAVAQCPVRARRQIPGAQIRVGKIFRQQAEARQNRRPAMVCRADLQDVYLQHVTWLCALDQ